MAKEPKKLDELFHDTLKDIYYAEKKILAALPKMAKAAESDDLRAAFEKHHRETEGQIERLEQVFEAIDQKPQARSARPSRHSSKRVIDHEGIQRLACARRRHARRAQAVEHYEISRYGTLCAWAEELGLEEAASFPGGRSVCRNRLY